MLRGRRVSTLGGHKYAQTKSMLNVYNHRDFNGTQSSHFPTPSLFVLSPSNHRTHTPLEKKKNFPRPPAGSTGCLPRLFQTKDVGCVRSGVETYSRSNHGTWAFHLNSASLRSHLAFFTALTFTTGKVVGEPERPIYKGDPPPVWISPPNHNFHLSCIDWIYEKPQCLRNSRS